MTKEATSTFSEIAQTLLDRSNDLEALRIKKKAEKLKRRINEDTGDYNFEEQK